jgi:hypothetical protein
MIAARARRKLFFTLATTHRMVVPMSDDEPTMKILRMCAFFRILSLLHPDTLMKRLRRGARDEQWRASVVPALLCISLLFAVGYANPSEPQRKIDVDLLKRFAAPPGQLDNKKQFLREWLRNHGNLPIPVRRDKWSAYVDDKAIWSTSVIPVCWIDPSPAHVKERLWVQEALVTYWGHYVTFTGWNACNGAFGSIMIRVADERPHTKGLGPGKGADVTLNFLFNNVDPGCQSPATVRQACIMVDAAHEIGHSLGFAHEQNRPDTPPNCTGMEQGSDGTVMVGEFDHESIMNYCNPALYTRDWSFFKARAGSPNSTDYQAMQKYYRYDDLWNRIISNGGYCLNPAEYSEEAPGALLASGLGNRAWITRCRRPADALNRLVWWHYDPANQQLRASTYKGIYGYLAVIKTGGINDAVALVGNPAVNLAKWKLDNVEIIHVQSGLCLDGSMSSGVGLKNCHGGRSQQWSLLENGSLRGAADGYCLALINGTHITTAPCNSSQDQRWSLSRISFNNPKGSIQTRYLPTSITFSDRIHDWFNDYALHGKVRLELRTPNASGSRDASWVIHGNFREKLTGQCINSVDLADGVGLYPCGTAAPGSWFYYP